MKKYTSLLLVTAMLLSCASCGSKDGSESVSGTTSAKTTTESEAAAESETVTEKETVSEAETVPGTSEISTEAPSKTSVNEKPAQASELSGLYLSPLYSARTAKWMTGDLDEVISEGMSGNNTFLQANDGKVNPLSLSFDSGKFRTSVPATGASAFYSGSVYEQNGRLWFEYEEFDSTAKDGSRYTCNINDTPSSDEKEDPRSKNIIKNMSEFNEKGLFFKRIVPDLSLVDKSMVLDILPHFFAPAGQKLPPTELYSSGDVLWHETYGAELAKTYTPGSDFTINYDMIKLLEEDPCSAYNKKESQNDKDDLVDYYVQNIVRLYGLPEDSTDTSTKLTFSGGKWEWKNCEGGLINNGSYQESEKFPGLIAIYTDETSKIKETDRGIFDGQATTLIYISDNKDITYPVLVKYE